MNFDLSEEQILIRDSAGRAVREYCELGRRRDRIARGESFDSAFWSQFAELGWIALCIPEEEGGLGGSAIDIALLMIELGRGASSEPLVSSAVLCANLLVASGWDGRAAWIERIMAGDVRMAFARLETAALGAGELVLEGTSPVVFDGDGVEAYLVHASDASGAAVLALVPADAPGLTTDTYALHDGSRAVDLSFSQVRVLQVAILARGAEAEGLVEDAVAMASLACQAAAVGSMETCLELCGDYAATRMQFRQAIGKFQSIQHMMSDMLVAAHNARSMLYFALSRVDADRASRTAAVALSQMAIGKAGLMVSRTGIQIHGGYGMTDEFAIGHHHRYQFVLERRFCELLPSIASLKG